MLIECRFLNFCPVEMRLSGVRKGGGDELRNATAISCGTVERV